MDATSKAGPPIHQLVENVPHDLKIEQAWTSDGSLTLARARTTEIQSRAELLTTSAAPTFAAGD